MKCKSPSPHTCMCVAVYLYILKITSKFILAIKQYTNLQSEDNQCQIHFPPFFSNYSIPNYHYTIIFCAKTELYNFHILHVV